MIARLWHGWTTKANAGIYEELLKKEVFPSVEAKKVKGYRKISLLRLELENETEFITIMLFNNLKAVKEFAGNEYEKSYVPQKARQILSRHDETSQHYEIVHELIY